jgi:hypothetical protein
MARAMTDVAGAKWTEKQRTGTLETIGWTSVVFAPPNIYCSFR